MGQYNPEIHHRRSIRLKEYDYSQAGAYFITICTHKRVEMFGEITNDGLHINERGEIIEAMWDTLPNRFPGIELDHFIAKTFSNASRNGANIQSCCQLSSAS